MEKQILILSGGRDAATLVTENNTLVATRRSASVGEAILHAVLALLVAGFLLPAFFVILFMLIIAVTEKSLLLFVAGVIIFAGWLIGMLALLAIQGTLFSFRARIDMHRHSYSLRNGVTIARLSLAAGDTVSICSIYSRGDWGYVAYLKRGRIWLGPVIPSAIIGTKHDAFVEAKRVKQFIEDGLPSIRVSLDYWGKAKIKPDVEYIR